VRHETLRLDYDTEPTCYCTLRCTQPTKWSDYRN